MDRGNATENGRTGSGYGDLATSEQGNYAREIDKESTRDSKDLKTFSDRKRMEYCLFVRFMGL